MFLKKEAWNSERNGVYSFANIAPLWTAQAPDISTGENPDGR